MLAILRLLQRVRQTLSRNRHGQPPVPPQGKQTPADRDPRDMTLYESEEKYRSLFESSRDAIMILYPPNWNFTACNPATVELFGARDATHFTSLGPWDVSPEVQPDGEASMAKAPKMIGLAMQNGSHLFEWMHKRINGPDFLASVQLTRITLKGTPGLQATVRDITEQRRSEVALRAYATFQKAMLDNAGHAIISCKPDGTIQGFNPAAEALLGYRAEELVDKHSPAVFHDSDQVVARAHQFSEELGTTIKPGFDVFVEKCRKNLLNEHEWTYICKDGTRRTVLLNVTALREADGRITGYLGIASDITPLKQAARELLVAKEAAEAANRSKSQFLANMSHEIRTPMNGVLGMTELLLTTTLDARQHHLTQTIQQSGEALLAVINDILDFSKIEAGKLKLEQVDFDIQETVEDAVELFANAAQRKGLELTCRMPGVSLALRGDPTRLRQALLNLVSNAIKFTPQGEINVRVEIAEETTETVTLRFIVKDSGLGIPLDAQGRIFDAFSQADGTTTRRFGGTGLGLTIVKELAALMQGQVGVESHVGSGSTFWFTAVLRREPAPTTPAQDAELTLAGKRVLVVDDTATNRDILHDHLRAWNAHPTLASSGQEALDSLASAADQHQIFDLAILDLHMPDMDGLRLAQLIRSDKRLAGLPLLMLTSVGYDAHAPDAPRIDSWVTKPVRKSLLRRSLLGLLHHIPRMAGPPSAAPTVSSAFRILLVEDTPVNRDVATGMLEILGHHVSAVENGRLGVEAAAQQPFDLILMDCQMPEMDGFAATAAIRQQEALTDSRRHVPIIALTANAMEGDHARCLAAGMDDYLSKPFTVAQMHAILTKWLRPQSVTTNETDPTPSAQAVDAEPPAAREEEPITACIDKTAWDAILSLQRPGRPDILSRVLATYLADSRLLVEQIRTAVQSQDSEALSRAAHRLKSSSAQLGVLATAAHCKELETLGRLARIDEAAHLVSQLIEAHQQACTTITSELHQRSGR